MGRERKPSALLTPGSRSWRKWQKKTKNNKPPEIKDPDKEVEDRVKALHEAGSALERFVVYYLVNFRVISKEIRAELREMGLLLPDNFYNWIYSETLGYKGRVERCLFKHIRKDKVLFLERDLPKKRRDTHHIIPSSRKEEGFETAHKTNLITLEYDFHHSRWHGEHKNNHPLEILAEFFINQRGILSDDVGTKMRQIVDIGKDIFYRKEVLS